MDAGAAPPLERAAPVNAPLRREPPPTTRVRARYLAVGLVALLLLISTGVTLFSSYLAVSVPEQLDEGEPLIYGLAARILQHQPLYQSIDHQPFVQVHYTPVYYYAVAVLRRYVGPGFAPGRLLSVLAGLTTAAVVAYLAGKRARWWVGGLAALAFLGLGLPGGPAPFMALERVDMLGVALAMMAIAVLSHGTSPRHVVLGALLAGAAVLTKQSLFAAGLAGVVWLATFDVRKAGLFGVTFAATVLLPAAAFQWTSAGAFWQNIGPDNPTPTSFEFGTFLLREMLAIQGLPLVLAAYYVVSNRAWAERQDRLLLVYWLASAIPVVGIFKVGSNHNYWIELAAVTAVLAALGIWRAVHFRNPIAAMVPPLLALVALALLVPARFIASRDTTWLPVTWTLDMDRYTRLADEASDFQSIVNEVSGEKGEILAEGLDVVVLGNHPVPFEPFAFSMLESQGRWNSAPLVDDICSGRITMLVLVYPMETDIYPVGLKEFPMWPNSVMTALRHTMTGAAYRDWHFLYRSPRSLDPAAIGACEDAASAGRTADN